MTIVYSLVLVLLFLVVVGIYLFLFDVIAVRHDFATSNKAVRKVSEIIKLNNKTHGVLYDLGSSRGGFVFRISRKNPGLKVLGIDNSHYRIWLSKAIGFLYFNKAEFVRQDIFRANISAADVIYVYLGAWLMSDLQNKLKREMKPGSIAILNTQSLPDWHASQIYFSHPGDDAYEKLFVYVQT